MPLPVSLSPRKYQFIEQRIAGAERPASGGNYFWRAELRAEDIWNSDGLIISCRADLPHLDTLHGVVIRWQPLVPADALDIAGAA
jgi:hypothetical protein